MKKSGTKHLILFLLLIILGTVIFFRGWSQIKIKPDSCGVIQTITNGILKTPVISGEFSWNWQFLIPGNAKIKTFTLKPYTAGKYISGIIPQTYVTDAYTDILNYNLTFNISLSYTPEAVVQLLEKNYISNDEDFQKYLDGVASEICQQAAAFYLSKARTDINFNPASVKRADVLNGINAFRQFPELDITIFALTDFKLPNYGLYNHLEAQVLKNSIN